MSNLTCNELNESMKELAKSANMTSAKLNVLAEVLKVDPEEVKKALMLNALEDLKDGKEPCYEGDLFGDLWVWLRTIERENEQLNDELTLANKENKQLAEDRRKYCDELYGIGHRLRIADHVLTWELPQEKMPEAISKKRYSREEVNFMLEHTRNLYKKHIEHAVKALED